MIKSSSLTSLIKKVINKGIETFFIIRKSGEILCMEVGNESSQTFSDIISSMRIEYDSQILKDEKLNCLIIENEDSYVITSILFSWNLIKKIELGILKKYLEGLTQNLSKLLEPCKDIIHKKEEESNNEKLK